MAPTLQSELPFVRVAEDDPRIEVLARMLKGQDWLKANEIIARHFETSGHHWHDRLIRDLAAESHGRIAGGQNGYKLVGEMTAEEKDHACHWMKSQARKMDARADEIEMVWIDANRKREQI
jgi:hypothetical protein